MKTYAVTLTADVIVDAIDAEHAVEVAYHLLDTDRDVQAGLVDRLEVEEVDDVTSTTYTD